MSQSAYMTAIADHLRNTLGLDSSSCEVGIDGMPKPECGEEYIAVHPGEWSADESEFDHGIYELVGVLVTVTRRIGQYPMDRLGTELLNKATTGLEAVCRKITAGPSRIHMSYVVMNAANVLIDGSVNKFITPLRLRNVQTPELKGFAWFSAKPPETESGAEMVGVARTITFGGAVRVQTLDIMT